LQQRKNKYHDQEAQQHVARGLNSGEAARNCETCGLTLDIAVSNEHRSTRRLIEILDRNYGQKDDE